MTIQNQLDNIQKNITQEIEKDIISIAEKVSEEQMIMMENRTLSGIDIYGNIFKPYSESYIPQKMAITSWRPGDPVDLWLYGDMLPDITSKTRKTSNSAISDIFFQSKIEEMKAHHNQNLGRLFWGISEETQGDNTEGIEQNSEAKSLFEITKIYFEQLNYSVK